MDTLGETWTWETWDARDVWGEEDAEGGEEREREAAVGVAVTGGSPFRPLTHPGVASPDFPPWQDPGRGLGPDGALDVETVEAMRAQGMPLSEWESHVQETCAPLVVCNSLQTNFYTPWGFAITEHCVERQGYTWGDPTWSLEGTALEARGFDPFFWVWQLDTLPGHLAKVTFEDNPQLGVPPRMMDVRGEVACECKLRYAVTVAPLLADGEVCVDEIHHVSLASGQVTRPNGVLWDATRAAAFTAIGASADGAQWLVCVLVPVTVRALAEWLRDTVGLVEAGLLGGSADVGICLPFLGKRYVGKADSGSGRAGERGRRLNSVLVLPSPSPPL